MAATSTSSITELGGKYVLERDCTGANGATPNVTGAAGIIYMVQINNEANSTPSYLKIRDNTAATPATTTANGVGTPHFSFKAPVKKAIAVIMSIVFGILALVLGKRKLSKEKKEIETPPENTASDVALDDVQESLKEELDRIKTATDGDSPADDLADLGNARKRR